MSTQSRPRGAAAPGFTLIEMMIVLVIATVLIGIAVPYYTYELRTSRRTDAKTALLDLASREEAVFATTSAYSTAPSALGYSGANFPVTVGSGYYTVNVCVPAGGAGPCADPNVAAPSFLVYATPVAGMGQDKDTSCQLFTVDSTGQQGAQDGGGNNTSSTCWP